MPSHLINILEAPTPYIIGVHDDGDYLKYDIFDEIDDVRCLCLKKNILKISLFLNAYLGCHRTFGL